MQVSRVNTGHLGAGESARGLQDPRLCAGSLGSCSPPGWVQFPGVGTGHQGGPKPALTPHLPTSGYLRHSAVLGTPFTCDLEDSDCGWQDVGTSAYGWVRGRASLAAWGVGPHSDHTTGTDVGKWGLLGEQALGTHSSTPLDYGCPRAGVPEHPSLWSAGDGADPWRGRSSAGPALMPIHGAAPPLCSLPSPGWFLVTTSPPEKTAATAWLMSPEMQEAAATCEIRAWYHLSGSCESTQGGQRLLGSEDGGQWGGMGPSAPMAGTELPAP